MPQVTAEIDALLAAQNITAYKAALAALGAESTDPDVVEQLALLNEVPDGYLGFDTVQSSGSFSVQVTTSTGYLAVQSWDGAITIHGTGSAGTVIAPSIAIPTSGAWSGSAVKRVLMWSCTSGTSSVKSGNVTRIDDTTTSAGSLTSVLGGKDLVYAWLGSAAKLRNLPLWENVTEVRIYNNAGLTTLPLWPSVTSVYCSSCTGLTSLPLWPSVSYVNCYGCTGLTSLPLWPSVTAVVCSSCTGLESLPLWPNVTTVDCSSCTGLTSLPLWPSVTSVSCSSCTGLTSLPLWPSISDVDCGSCISLSSTAMDNFYIGMASLPTPPDGVDFEQLGDTGDPTEDSYNARITLESTYNWTISY